MINSMSNEQIIPLKERNIKSIFIPLDMTCLCYLSSYRLDRSLYSNIAKGNIK